MYVGFHLQAHNPASAVYVNSKVKTCAELGMFSEKITPPETITTEERVRCYGTAPPLRDSCCGKARRDSRAECDRLAAAGFLEAERYVLIEGELVLKVPMGYLHMLSPQLLMTGLQSQFGALHVLPEASIDLRLEDHTANAQNRMYASFAARGETEKTARM